MRLTNCSTHGWMMSIATFDEIALACPILGIRFDFLVLSGDGELHSINRRSIVTLYISTDFI